MIDLDDVDDSLGSEYLNKSYSDLESFNQEVSEFCDFDSCFTLLTLNVGRISSIAKFERLKTHFLSLRTKPDLFILVETWIVEGSLSI